MMSLTNKLDISEKNKKCNSVGDLIDPIIYGVMTLGYSACVGALLKDIFIDNKILAQGAGAIANYDLCGVRDIALHNHDTVLAIAFGGLALLNGILTIGHAYIAGKNSVKQ